MKKQALIISVHPDDETVGAGFLLSILSEKYDVHLRTLAVVPHFNIRATRQFTVSSLKEIHAKALVFYNLCSSYYITEGISLDQMTRLSLTSNIDKQLEQVRPDIVFIPYISWHHDHSIARECCRASLRIGKHSSSVKSIYEYDYPPMLFPIHEDGYSYIKLKENHMKKIKSALKVYEEVSLLDSSNSFFSAKGIEKLAEIRGVEIGVKYATKVKLVRSDYV